MIRNKLSHIKDEEELFEYFKEHAGYDESMQCYICAGLVSDDTAVLLKKLKQAWADDQLADAIFGRSNLQKEIDSIQDEIDQLEEVKTIVASNHQKLLIKMGEKMSELAELENQ